MNNKSVATVITVTAVLMTLTACSNLTGIGGSASLSCPRPDGTTCKPVTEVYRDSAIGTKRVAGDVNGATVTLPKSAAALPQLPTASAASVVERNMPLRTPPRVLRAWIAPFEDSDGDLFEGMRVYLHLDAGRWSIEHQREAASRGFAPLKPPAKSISKDAPATPTTSMVPGTLPGNETMQKITAEGDKNAQ
jgi:conjugal transfer pilus assembly protein TraV